MPYYRCADCDLTVHSGAGYSNLRVCPECGADLGTASRMFAREQRHRELHRQMAREPQAAGAARHELALLLGELDRAEFEVVALLVSELIANSVEHAGPLAGGLLALDVSIADRSVRVMVTDGGSGFVPAVPATEARVDDRWGLRLVDVLADRWGVDGGSGTAVWFELDRVADRQLTASAPG